MDKEGPAVSGCARVTQLFQEYQLVTFRHFLRLIQAGGKPWPLRPTRCSGNRHHYWWD
jgi:hypothetical protein